MVRVPSCTEIKDKYNMSPRKKSTYTTVNNTHYTRYRYHNISLSTVVSPCTTPDTPCTTGGGGAVHNIL
jgi:hypothetical protein